MLTATEVFIYHQIKTRFYHLYETSREYRPNVSNWRENNGILLGSDQNELTRSYFLRETLLSDNETGQEHFGNFCKTDLCNFRDKSLAICRENCKNLSSKKPKIFETVSLLNNKISSEIASGQRILSSYPTGCFVGFLV